MSAKLFTNTMGEQLQNARLNLQSKVEERTKALTLANAQLAAAVKEVTRANRIGACLRMRLD
jgi:C4-dicarboxylate-specific signal transduction histidine kinase